MNNIKLKKDALIRCVKEALKPRSEMYQWLYENPDFIGSKLSLTEFNHRFNEFKTNKK